MHTSSPERIASLTAAGHWGSETLHGLLARHARERPDELAVKDQPDRAALTGDPPRALSWLELERASAQLALQLRDRGVGAGDRVILQLPNIAELLLCYYALSRLGAIASPVPVQYGAHELQHIRDVLHPVAAISIANLRGQALAQTAAEAMPGLPVWRFGEELGVNTLPAASALSWQYDANRVVTICWTSGTTGTLKGVPRSHNLWLASARATAQAADYRAGDTLLNPFPMVNMSALGGFVFPAALHGCSIVLHHPLDPPLFLKQMQDERVNFTIAPPPLLNQLAQSPELWAQFDFSALRRVGSGSAPLSADMIATFRDSFGVEVVNFYGSNEGIALFSTPEQAPDPTTRAALFPLPPAGAAIETRIADAETGHPITEPGVAGELLVRGATIFDGYLDHDNSDVFTDDGYFRTGDLVELSDEAPAGYRIVGRCKDIINRGGMKISPQELDLALGEHPDVAEAAVCAYPDVRLGEKVCACLVMREGRTVLEMAALQDYLLQRGFARFKLPERIEALDALPRNPLGKVQRFALTGKLTATRQQESHKP